MKTARPFFVFLLFVIISTLALSYVTNPAAVGKIHHDQCPGIGGI